MGEIEDLDWGSHFCWFSEESFDRISVSVRRQVTSTLPNSIRAFVDPDDVVQESWKCLIQKLESPERPQFGCNGEVAAYLLTIARFKVQNWGKKARRAAAWVVAANREVASSDPFWDVVERDATDDIIRRLPEQFRCVAGRVLHLRLLGHSVKEVSAQIRVSPGRVQGILKVMQKHVTQSGIFQVSDATIQ